MKTASSHNDKDTPAPAATTTDTTTSIAAVQPVGNRRPLIAQGRYTPIVGVVLALIVGFAGGMAYQHHRNSDGFGRVARTIQANGPAMGGRGGRMAGRLGVFGSVTAVSATSITVNNSRTGTSSTLTIDSNTKVTNNGSAAAVTDIKDGDQVMVRTSSSNTKLATQITINPAMPAGPSAAPGAGGATPNSTPDNQNQSSNSTDTSPNGVGAGGPDQSVN